jgi:biopolymer transport protein ExbD
MKEKTMSLEKVIEEYANEGSTSINLSPMIDMLFLLLLFFMVTTTFDKSAAIQINKSEAETATVTGETKLTILLDSTGNYWIEQFSVSLQQALDQTSAWVDQHPGGTILIIPDRNSKMDPFVKIVDGLSVKGIRNFAIGTQIPSRRP